MPRGQPRLISFRGQTKSLTDWARELGLGVVTLKYRLESPRWTIEEALTVALHKKPHHRRKHGQSKTDLHKTWCRMRDRCNRQSNKYWHRYGGRGIKVCERWNKFEAFAADMGARPSPRHSLERLNNDGDYEPSNCVWATKHQQALNRRTSIRVTFGGQTKVLKEWATDMGMNYLTLYCRYKRGDRPPDLFRPVPS